MKENRPYLCIGGPQHGEWYQAGGAPFFRVHRRENLPPTSWHAMSEGVPAETAPLKIEQYNLFAMHGARIDEYSGAQGMYYLWVIDGMTNEEVVNEITYRGNLALKNI